MDVDLIEPKIDPILQLITSKIGEKYGLDMSWLNSAEHIFAKDLPARWRQRAKLLFKGKSLTAKMLGRKDLIAAKLYSFCSRGLKTDKDDLISLKPSSKEIDFAKRWILSLKDSPKKTIINSHIQEIIKFREKS